MVTFPSDVQQYSMSQFSGNDWGIGWEVDSARCAVLIHDFLPYYLKVLPQSLVAELEQSCGRLITCSREASIPLITSAPRPAYQLYQRGLGARLWGKGPTLEESEERIIDGLSEPEVPCMRKRSLSAFYGTDLEIEMRRAGKDQLVILGVFTGGGILATSFDALARDIECFVVSDGTADFTEKRHAQALSQIGETTGQIISQASFLERILKKG